jgi:hypothetical protein
VRGIGSLPRKNATKPELLSKTEPEYGEAARKAKPQGTVVLMPSLGRGRDERAMEAVNLRRFRPATMEGNPVAMRAMAELNFRSL